MKLLDVNAAAEEVPDFGVGKGITSVRTGLRLRYEVTRKFAPYVGGYWAKSYGDTADLARASGDAIKDTGVVADVRMWF